MSKPAELTIGGLAVQAGATSPTIRYYESIGLLPAAARRNGQRRYGADDVRRVTFIRRCRDFGFTIEQVRELLAVMEDGRRPCSEARQIAQTHADAVRARIAELRALAATIAEFIRRCDSLCAGGQGPDCVPLAELTYRASEDSSRKQRSRAPAASREC